MPHRCRKRTQREPTAGANALRGKAWGYSGEREEKLYREFNEGAGCRRA